MVDKLGLIAGKPFTWDGDFTGNYLKLERSTLDGVVDSVPSFMSEGYVFPGGKLGHTSHVANIKLIGSKLLTVFTFHLGRAINTTIRFSDCHYITEGSIKK